MADNSVRKALTWVGTASAHPAAFVIVLIYAAPWVLFERQSLNGHAVVTLATWLMTLFI